jgi:hypothetical protein
MVREKYQSAGHVKNKIIHQATSTALSREHLDYSIAAAANDPPAIATPDDRADPFTTHQSMTCNFLRAASLFKVPKPQAGVVPCRH